MERANPRFRLLATMSDAEGMMNEQTVKRFVGDKRRSKSGNAENPSV
jgi:hypothetical protein